MKMRFHGSMFLAAAVLLTACGTARAALFFVDKFDYADGELTDHNDGPTGSNVPGANVSGGLWTTHSGGGFPTSIDVLNGQAVLKQGNPASEDANRLAETGNPDFTIGLGETWYFAALVTINDERPDPANTPLLGNEYFMHFKDAGNNFRGRAYVTDPSTGTGGEGFRFALSTTSGGPVAFFPDDLEFGKQYAIVVSYTLSSVIPAELPGGTTKLWVNPTDESSASVMDAVASAGLTALNSLGLRQAFGGTGSLPNYEVLVDAVALGTTFDAVLSAVIPEPSTTVLALFGLAGLLARSRRSLA